MASKRQTEYRTRFLILDGSAENSKIAESNMMVQEALNDAAMRDSGFELDQIVSLSRGSEFTNFIMVLIVFGRTVRE